MVASMYEFGGDTIQPTTGHTKFKFLGLRSKGKDSGPEQPKQETASVNST